MTEGWQQPKLQHHLALIAVNAAAKGRLPKHPDEAYYLCSHHKGTLTNIH
jgi:hypothetical protein